MSPISGLSGPAAPQELPAATRDAQPGFATALEAAIERVDTIAVQGDSALAALGKGGDVDLHGAMVALQEADIAVRAMVTVRDKLMSAYEQLMGMAI